MFEFESDLVKGRVKIQLPETEPKTKIALTEQELLLISLLELLSFARIRNAAFYNLCAAVHWSRTQANFSNAVVNRVSKNKQFTMAIIKRTIEQWAKLLIMNGARRGKMRLARSRLRIL